MGTKKENKEMSELTRELLINDLYSRLKYRPYCYVEATWCKPSKAEKLGFCDIISFVNGTKRSDYGDVVKVIKPYLRPMSSMTPKEKDEYDTILANDKFAIFDWLNEKHFDYRGLIELGGAISTEEYDPYLAEINDMKRKYRNDIADLYIQIEEIKGKMKNL